MDKARAGDSLRRKIRPRVWNSMVDAARYYQETQSLGRPAPQTYGQIDPTAVYIRNDSGGDRSAGDALAVDSFLLNDRRRTHIWCSAELPDSSKTCGVLIDPTPAGQFGWLRFAGVALATVTINSESDTHARPVSGSPTWTSSTSGPLTILEKPAGTGTKTCTVRVGVESSAAAPVYEIVTSDQQYNLEYPSTESPPGYALLTPDPLLSGGGIDVYRDYTYVANHCLYHAGQCFERGADDKTLRCSVAGAYWSDFTALVEDRWTQPTTWTTTSGLGGFQTVAGYNKSLIELRLQVAYAGTDDHPPNWSHPFSVSYPGGYRYSQLHLRRMRYEDHLSVTTLRMHTIEGSDKIDLAVGSEVRLMLQLRHYGTFSIYTDSPCRLWYSQLHLRRMGDVPDYDDPTPHYGDEWEPSDE